MTRHTMAMAHQAGGSWLWGSLSSTGLQIASFVQVANSPNKWAQHQELNPTNSRIHVEFNATTTEAEGAVGAREREGTWTTIEMALNFLWASQTLKSNRQTGRKYP